VAQQCGWPSEFASGRFRGGILGGFGFNPKALQSMTTDFLQIDFLHNFSFLKS
jgi:hypothetical protein